MKADVSANRWRSALLHGVFIAALLALRELAATRNWIDPTFFGQPSGVAKFLWNNLATAKLWTDLGWPMAGVMASFVLGSAVAFAVGLAFVRWPQVERFADPYFNALNVMPRIALAPLF